MTNMAKWLLLGVLALPFAELLTFIVVAANIGLAWTLALILAGSLCGMLVLRHAGGNHIARIKVALDDGGITAMQADSDGFLILLAGILLLVPGFITDMFGLVLLLAPLRRGLTRLVGRGAAPARADGVVDLEPEQWRHVPDPALPGRRNNDDK